MLTNLQLIRLAVKRLFLAATVKYSVAFKCGYQCRFGGSSDRCSTSLFVEKVNIDHYTVNLWNLEAKYSPYH